MTQNYFFTSKLKKIRVKTMEYKPLGQFFFVQRPVKKVKMRIQLKNPCSTIFKTAVNMVSALLHQQNQK